MVYGKKPEFVPFPDDILNYPLRPWEPDDPDEEKYEVLYDID
jgi:hypothetical protein